LAEQAEGDEQALYVKLRSPVAEDRSAAALAIGRSPRINRQAALKPLLEAYKGSIHIENEDRELMKRIAYVLGNWTKDAKGAIPTLVEVLNDTTTVSLTSREDAVRALAKIVEPSDKTEILKQALLNALVTNVNSKHALEGLSKFEVDGVTFDRYADALRNAHIPWYVRRDIAVAMGKVGARFSNQVVKLIPILECNLTLERDKEQVGIFWGAVLKTMATMVPEAKQYLPQLLNAHRTCVTSSLEFRRDYQEATAKLLWAVTDKEPNAFRISIPDWFFDLRANDDLRAASLYAIGQLGKGDYPYLEGYWDEIRHNLRVTLPPPVPEGVRRQAAKTCSLLGPKLSASFGEPLLEVVEKATEIDIRLEALTALGYVAGKLPTQPPARGLLLRGELMSRLQKLSEIPSLDPALVKHIQDSLDEITVSVEPF
jgi:HEAT repeat protein